MCLNEVSGIFFFCYCVLLLCVPFSLPGLEGWGTLSRLMEVASNPSCGSLLPTAWWGVGEGVWVSQHGLHCQHGSSCPTHGMGRAAWRAVAEEG